MLATPTRLVLGLVALLLLWSTGAAAQPAPPVDVKTLLASDVIVAPGGSFTPDERTTLTAAATELAKVDENGESFPSKFIAVPAPAEGVNLDLVARDLRRAGLEQLKDADALDGVFLIAPRALGIGANAFQDEIQAAFAAELDTLRRDRAEGTVAIARRLQYLDAINARVSASDDTNDGISSVMVILIGAVIVVGAVGILLARRAGMRRNKTPPSEAPPGGSS